MDPRNRLVPLPAQVHVAGGSLTVDAHTRIVVGPGAQDCAHTVNHLVADVQKATGLHLSRSDVAGTGDIVLQLDPRAAEHGDEGYELTISSSGATLRAAHPHGLWNATRTLVQLYPHAPANTSLPAVHIVDRPRFEWRGAMLDVARHFFGVDQVLRFIELMARFKLNRLHLHLTDDQGWRLAIDGWPTLTSVGGNTCVGGGYGGWFSRADYQEIVAHAARHFITVVPEIDMPGHTNAALTSIPALNLDGIAPPPYTDKGVGFSSLHLAAPATRRFITDVIGQLAADTPGRYLHIGGDEAHTTDHAEYREFIELLQREVLGHGKQMIGWEEITSADLADGTIVQHWLHADAVRRAPAATRFVMSPAAHTYLDMQHTPECRIGRRWAGFIDVDTAYGWDPAALIDGIGDERIAGVEAPLWTEKVATFDDVQHLCFPRLACLGEVGWTAQSLRGWDAFRPRLTVHADRLADIGVPLYRSALLG
ncbi:MAG: beta-N-acetylhexosaminidase [Ilumatobacteraceae bacterium]